MDWTAGLYPYDHFLQVTVTSGTADNLTGRLTATAQGFFDEDGFPAYVVCPGVNVTFTLTPHP